MFFLWYVYLEDEKLKMTDESKSSRLSGFSNSIDIKKLERETQKLLYLGFVVAIAFHAALDSFITYKRTEVKVVKPIEVKLVVRPPRMTRPFVIPKKDLLKRILKRKIMMRLPSGKFKFKSLLSIQDLMKIMDTFEFDLNIGEEVIAEIIVEIDSIYDAGIEERFDFEQFIADIPDYREGITREPENVISLKEYLLSVDDFDTGQYKGLVIKDPVNKQDIKGFVYIPVDVWGAFLRPVGLTTVIGLMQGFKKYTGIDVKIDPHLFIDSPSVMKYPFIYISADKRFNLSERGKENLLKYFSSGGFVLLDPYSLPAYVSCRQMIIDACEGREHIYPLSDDHPVFHTFFDFDEMPVLFPTLENEGLMDATLPPDGVWLDNRLVAILPPSPYRPFGKTWSDYKSPDRFENPSFRLAVNIIVYALIREGSIAKKYINADALDDYKRSAIP